MRRMTRRGKRSSSVPIRLALATAALPIMWLGSGCTAIDGVRNQISERFSGNDAAVQGAADKGAGQQSLNAATQPPATRPAATQPVKVEAPSLLMQIEQRLAELGYNPGPVDGRATARTEAAIQDFQLDNDLKIDGKPTESLLKSLRMANKKSS